MVFEFGKKHVTDFPSAVYATTAIFLPPPQNDFLLFGQYFEALRINPNNADFCRGVIEDLEKAANQG